MTFKEEIIEILHEHTRGIMVEGKNKPLVRRGIKKQTADQIISILIQWAEGKKVKEGTFPATTPDYELGFNQALQDLLDYLKATKGRE